MATEATYYRDYGQAGLAAWPCAISNGRMWFLGSSYGYLEHGTDMASPIEEWVVCDGVKYPSSSDEAWTETISFFGGEEEARLEVGDVILYRENDLPM